MRPEQTDFQWQSIRKVQLGVCLVSKDNSGKEVESFVYVPAKEEVHAALRKMGEKTLEWMRKEVPTGAFPKFELAEKHSAIEVLVASLKATFLSETAALYAMTNLALDPKALDDPSRVRMYFVEFYDINDKKAIGCRRAGSMKSLQRRNVVMWVKGILDVAKGDVFVLDSEFDYLITEEHVFILKPGQFEAAAVDTKVICAQAAKALPKLETTARFIRFTKLSDYVKKHPMAARLLTSIMTRDDLDKMSADKLKALLTTQAVKFTEKDGIIEPNEGSELDFLKLLDRRLYDVELVEGVKEQYQAASRSERGRIKTVGNGKPVRTPREKQSTKNTNGHKMNGQQKTSDSPDAMLTK